MLETLKKKSMKKVIVWVVVLYIAAVACIAFTGKAADENRHL